MQWPSKDPDEVLDYPIDWTDALDGDTIATATFTLVSAQGLTIDSQSNTDTIAVVWLSGGTAGKVAKIQCRIVTDGGRTMDKTVKLPIYPK